MTIIACARRKSDGLLTWPQTSPQTPNQDAIIQKGVSSFGGDPGDWEMVTLTPADGAAVQAAMPGRTFLMNEQLTHQPKPALTSDKTQIEDDGIDEAAITFDSKDAQYVGSVVFTVTAPNGTQTSVNKTAVAGVATLTITTLLPGKVIINARAESHGDGILTVEGI